jgi:PAS domain S-box-containing protein
MVGATSAGQKALNADGYEQLYLMLLDAIPCSVLLVDSQTRIVSVNRNFLEKAQRRDSTTIGQRIETVFPPAMVEQMDLAGRIRAVFDSACPTKGERMIYRAPGVVTRTYYYSLLPLLCHADVKHVMVLLEDVTEQVRLGAEARRAERHLASVVESAPDLVLSMDVNGRILTWNAAAERTAGFAAREAQGRMFFELCAPRHQARVEQVFADARQGKPVVMQEWDLATRAGTLVPVSWVGSLMRDDLGSVVAVVVVGRDLTERRKLEMQLLRSQKLAALGILAGGIAHEIRNPLSITSSAAQFLLEEPDDPVFRRQCLDKIMSGIDRTSSIIENLLRFARPGTPDDTVMDSVDLRSIVRDAAALANAQAGVQRVNMTLDLPDTPLLASGVPSLLQQVFVNLFLNALNAMPSGGSLRVRVDASALEARVVISDTGCGIPAADIDKIFDPFYTTRRPGKGIGLGLSICYSIVKQHLGSIEVDSAEQRGATFTVRLPLLRESTR